MGITKRKKVSCHVITYNHINYISKCIDGILMQKTNFDFEIVIGDDVSTDGTREIVKEYASRFPDLIRLNLRDKRGTGIPGKENFMSTLEMCDGEYITLCDGDDYWTDPLKLQKQVDFLEQNKEYSICFHNVKYIDISGGETKHKNFNSGSIEKTFTIEDLSTGNFIDAPSVVFRNNDKILPSWFKYSPIGDYPLHMINASFGLIKYFPEEMAVYRVGSGVWSTKSNIEQTVNAMFCMTLLMSHFKSNIPVFENLKKQYDNFKAILSKPFEDKKKLELNIKDHTFLEKNISLNYLLKILKIKILKKLKIKN